MLFFKPKQYGEELLPPPFPDEGLSGIGLEQDIKNIKKSALVETAIKQSIFDSPDVKEFDDLMKGLDEEANQKTPIIKKEKIPKKALPVKNVKAIELPETLEGSDIEGFEKDIGLNDGAAKGLKQESKNQKEILEAEEEIKSAIEKIKKQEKSSLFGRLFRKAEKIGIRQPEISNGKLLEKDEIKNHEIKNLMPQTEKFDSISAINDKLNKARTSLTNFDLRAAKADYIEIMKIYNNMNPEEQAKVYHDVREIYFERKSAEGLKV